MSSYARILVAVDFSSAAGTVGRQALELARRHDGELLLLHVVDYLPPLGFADDFTPSPALLVDEQELLKQGKISLKKYADKMDLSGARQLTVLGAPKQEIVRIAAEEHCGLIVIGSHGRHGLARLLGSTARGVLNDAPCDVLAVRIKE
ncbi:MAG: universal stress protein [Gammaproteobacteria bacterium]